MESQFMVEPNIFTSLRTHLQAYNLTASFQILHSDFNESFPQALTLVVGMNPHRTQVSFATHGLTETVAPDFFTIQEYVTTLGVQCS